MGGWGVVRRRDIGLSAVISGRNVRVSVSGVTGTKERRCCRCSCPVLLLLIFLLHSYSPYFRSTGRTGTDTIRNHLEEELHTDPSRSRTFIGKHQRVRPCLSDFSITCLYLSRRTDGKRRQLACCLLYWRLK